VTFSVRACVRECVRLC